MYNGAIQEAVRLSGIKKQNTVETVSATYKGTTYRKGMAVLLNVNDRGHELGRIVVLLVSEEKVYFVCEKSQSVPALDLGVHILQHDTQRHYVCISVDTLADYYPLPVYNFDDHLDVFVLHHSVFSGEV